MRNVRKDQRGLASIIIVGVIISVLALIVLGFAALMRREQRQALDQQLSAQARYAAESAINEKIALFRSNPGAFTSNTTCSDQGNTFNAANTQEIQTTCVKVSTAPGPIEFDEVTPSDSTIVWLDPGMPPAPALDRVVVTWQNTRGGADGTCWNSGYTTWPTNIAGDQMGLIRFDLTRVGPEGGTFTRDSLKDNQFGGVMAPQSTAPTASMPWTVNVADQPRVFGACDTNPATPAGVAGSYNGYAIIDLPNGNDRYVLRLRSLYRTNLVKVVGFDTSGQVVEFQGAQISIEATARVGDVVQRVQVRVPTGSPPANVLPDEALHTAGTGICKLLETEPGSTVDGC